MAITPISNKGWIVKTMTKHSHTLRWSSPHTNEYDQPVGTSKLADSFKEWKGFFLKAKAPLPEDGAKDREMHWSLYRKGRSLDEAGEMLEFFGPSWQDIRLLHAADVEENKKRKAALAERKEIKKGMSHVVKASHSRSANSSRL